MDLRHKLNILKCFRIHYHDFYPLITSKHQFELEAVEDLEHLSRQTQSLGLKKSAHSRQELQVQSLKEKQQTMQSSRDALAERHSSILESIAFTTTKIDTTRTCLAQSVIESRSKAQKETELNEKLTNITSKMTHMKIDLQTNERAHRFTEMLANLKRAFEGVHGRACDLIVPSLPKYGIAIGILLGRNTDAVIVDTEKTAIQCIQVSLSL